MFTNFMHCAPHYLKDFYHFVGAAHVILDDYSSTIFTPHDISRENIEYTRSDNCKTRETKSTPPITLPFTHHQTREHDTPSLRKTREVTSSSTYKAKEMHPPPFYQPYPIPYNDIDFEPIKSTPISQNFRIENNVPTIVTDKDMENYRKQAS